ncbi:alpha/beta hydrolase [Sulfitobacter sp. SK012]|uniref:alpha/beta hydrolase n=1 Tax=Sulfitobacter sp. SK012 TaxID=1389005 RepID=UPI0013B3E992|nr:alpha/beta hydrolase [Sulfitobacter sp. SK012]
MPLLRVNATASGIEVHHATHSPAGIGVTAAFGRMARTKGPAVIMVHGYRHTPLEPAHCPHGRIFRAAHWPAELKLLGDAGLGVAFGWHARGPLRQVHTEAVARGAEVASLVRLLRKQSPGRPVHIIAHSLGATVALSALHHLKSSMLDRMVLLSGASHHCLAQAALATPAGRSCDVLNLTSRENDLFDFLFERLIPGDRAIGQGIDAPRALTVQIDCASTLAALVGLGFNLGPTSRLICHRSAYARPGVMDLNAAALGLTGALSFGQLRAALPKQSDRRWSRLIPNSPLPLAAALKTRIMRQHRSKGPDHEHAY